MSVLEIMIQEINDMSKVMQCLLKNCACEKKDEDTSLCGKSWWQK